MAPADPDNLHAAAAKPDTPDTGDTANTDSTTNTGSTTVTADSQWQAEILQLAQLVAEARQIVIFTGAGISTESGIPDFRGPAGIWKTMTPINFQDFVASESVRRDAWSRKFNGPDLMAQAEPNTGHLAVAALVRRGKVSTVITQNVDGLHQRAGVSDAAVIEIHGNANYATCLSCWQRYELAPIKAAFLNDGVIPYCATCGGIIKTATISFGQAMPKAAMARAEQAVLGCDLLLVMGSSLSVYPAADLPRLAQQRGARLAIINNEATALDPACELVMHRPIGRSLSAATAPQVAAPRDGY